MHFLVYVRRSYKRVDSADISDEQQLAAALGMVPKGATHEVITDSGGHHSGFTDQRDGYQELIAKVRAGGVAGVAVYDLSRLFRNTELMLALKRELDRHDVALLLANMPGTRFDSATGRLMLTTVCAQAQFQRDVDSERMHALTRTIFEAGGHRGLDPFGYRSIPDVKPRTLEVVPHEAAIVRRIFELLGEYSTDDVARVLNREGLQHRADRPWTHSAVKDIWRRGRVYLGLVVTRRGREERPGRHEAIVSHETWNRAAAAIRRRRTGGHPAKPHRTYLLSRVLRCECGRTMAGTARVARGHEWRYYRCRQCVTSVNAIPLEQEVVSAIATMQMPDEVVGYLRDELRSRLALPQGETQRRRLEQRKARLAELYSWGDLSAEDYRAKRIAVDDELASLPSEDRLLLFDRNRAAFASMAEALAIATPALVKEAIANIVAWVGPDGSYDWTAPAAPFFVRTTAPPDGLEPSIVGLVEWYAA